MTSKDQIAVVGAGLMGTGIAHAFANSGHTVTLVDTNQAALARARDNIAKILADGVRLGKSTQANADAALQRLVLAATLDATSQATTLVIETATENLAIKQGIVRDAEARYTPDAVIATNTSALSITEIASAAKAPQRVVGMHFFNPVHKMKLVEVVRGLETTAATVQRARDWATAIGKTRPLTAAPRRWG